MPSHPAIRIVLVFVLIGLAVAASLSGGVVRVGLSISALIVIVLLSRTLPRSTRLPHPAVRGAMSVIGGVGIVAAGFGVYLVVVLAGASAPVLGGAVVVVAALAAVLTRA